MDTSLTDKQKNVLKIADCCSNLYGIYNISQLIKIYNEFYPNDKINKEDVYHICDIDEHEDICETVFYTDCVAHKSIADNDIDKIIKAQKGAVFYMPKSLKELLSYENRLYIEKNAEYDAFKDYLKKQAISSLKKKEIDEIIDLTLPASLKIGLPIEFTLYIFADYGITFSHAEFSSLALKYDKVSNTIRMWTRRGLTLKELTSIKKTKEKNKIS